MKANSPEDLQKIVEIAEAAGHPATIRNSEAHIEGPHEWAGVLNKAAFDAGIILTSLTSIRPTLEETFFEMTVN